MGRRWQCAEAVAAAVVLGASACRARAGRVGRGEERLFRSVNDAPDAVHLPAWTVMQAGSLAAVFVVSALQYRRGRVAVAKATIVAGTAVWAGVKVVKPLIGRRRPDELLPRVRVRGHAQSGLGYPSGHAAVAATLALIAAGRGGEAGQVAGVASGAAIGGARMYVGAHLPLDVAGGVAIGVLVARGANALLARTSKGPTP